jgi:hypothetical protein
MSVSKSSHRLFALLFSTLSTYRACVGIALSTVAVGCAAAASDDAAASSEAALTASITPGEFKLYAAPRTNPTPNCDVHTSLSLSNVAGAGAQAMLDEVVAGTCEIYVERQLRGYELRLDDTSCGSKIYKGSALVNDKVRSITITDHRTRMCRDRVPARIIVEETDDAGAVQTRYSLDSTPADES